mmetsp:Transcript_10771/g.16904  ORF Transcript_10771/g.16904 Transcript_10771/m.16904 type:complete len:285 (-) Transcript_10771:651-1505(-)
MRAHGHTAAAGFLEHLSHQHRRLLCGTSMESVDEIVLQQLGLLETGDPAPPSPKDPGHVSPVLESNRTPPRTEDLPGLALTCPCQDTSSKKRQAPGAVPASKIRGHSEVPSGHNSCSTSEKPNALRAVGGNNPGSTSNQIVQESSLFNLSHTSHSTHNCTHSKMDQNMSCDEGREVLVHHAPSEPLASTKTLSLPQKRSRSYTQDSAQNAANTPKTAPTGNSHSTHTHQTTLPISTHTHTHTHTKTNTQTQTHTHTEQTQTERVKQSAGEHCHHSQARNLNPTF